MPFPYKTVLITGATSGIGRALAESVIENGGFVIAAGRRKVRLDALVEQYGQDKVVAEVVDLSDLSALPAWTKKLQTNYPSLSAIVLNAGVQCLLDFTSPVSCEPDVLANTTHEIATNYLSPLHTTLLLLPHLRSLAKSGTSTAVIIVSSGLAVVPMPVYANYCASKAAVHTLAWQLRTQLEEKKLSLQKSGQNEETVRVIEIVPPAVQTELTDGEYMPQFGISLEDFTKETWAALEKGEEDELLIGPAREDFGHIEDERKKSYGHIVQYLRKL